MSRDLAAACLAIAAGACGDGAPPVVPDAAPGDGAPLADAVAATPGMLELAGAIAPVHDPAIIASRTGYHLFSTGTGLRIYTSVDLRNWSLGGQVFAAKPEWITTTDPNYPNELWAPDISYFGGQYHLYYSASRFGSNQSCIGHATSATLEIWEDRGAIICSASSDNWNAIDPAAVIDADGAAWLAFGSFWSGLKLIALDAAGARAGAEIHAIAARENTAVEAPFIVPHGGFYYLFESVDFCCQGAASSYKIAVGRAADIRGPYVDRAGDALLAGGGTLLVEGGPRWKGPGHNAVLRTAAGDYNLYHSYDADGGGIPTLRIAELRWSDDGWPISAGP